jgi:hypothetical protein
LLALLEWQVLPISLTTPGLVGALLSSLLLPLQALNATKVSIRKPGFLKRHPVEFVCTT